MAKSSRSSAKKANNQRKAANIFGPVESARAERLSARLMELASQPKPESDVMRMDDEEVSTSKDKEASADADETAMDVDAKKPSKGRTQKKGIQKRRQKRSSIVFPKYSDRLKKKQKAAARS